MGRKIPVNIEDEMRSSYMDYAMSVIIGRALPDVRDGLKPVHRRVLYAMHELKNVWNSAYKKSARVVGDVIGKYHPHGDSAVYDTIVRLAQPFSMRYCLVDGQGNFGSVDGDPPAAMRYTEVRMTRLSGELLADLEKETVDFQPNYDESTVEPAVLPARFPNLLVSGSAGIAVGMATNIPPHNLREVVDATVALIDDPRIGLVELMRHVPGPDFPTAGFIYGRSGIMEAYSTGRGVIKVRARTEIEEHESGGRTAIVVTELPYQVNKAKLLERIADLVRQKRIEGIANLRDESDREGMRMVIELRRDAMPEVVLNQLFAQTPMQTSFGIIMLAIVAGQPLVLNFKQLLQHFVQHRRDVVTRRCVFDLRKAEQRAHILEGLVIALDHIDEVVALIRGSATPAEARDGLMSRFGLSEIQAQEILNMRLQRLTGLERDKILAEYEEVKALIARLRQLLADDKLLMGVVKDELLEIREQYGDERRTEIVDDPGDIDLEDLIPDQENAVTVSLGGYIKRNALALYRAQRRGGKGRTGMSTKEEDLVSDLFVARSHDSLLIFTDGGRVFQIKVYQVPEGGPAARGRPIVNLIPIEADEKVCKILPISSFDPGKYILMATRNGIVKKTDLMAYSNIRSSGIIAIRFDEDDDLIGVQTVSDGDDVLLASREGLSIRFLADEVRPTARDTRGVRGVRLEGKDQVVAMEVLRQEAELLTVTTYGYGKRTRHDEYPVQHRGGKGVLTIRTSERNGHVVGMVQAAAEDHLLLITAGGKVIRMPIGQIRRTGRVAQGVRLIQLDEGEVVVGLERLADDGGAGEGLDDVELASLPPEDEPDEGDEFGGAEDAPGSDDDNATSGVDEDGEGGDE